jgi:hypothetical protein
MAETISGKMPVKSEAQKKQDLERIEAWIKKLIPSEWDKYDFRAKYDSTLSIDENKSAIREDIKVLIKDLKEQAKEVMATQERFETEKKIEAEKEVEEYNKNRVFSENKELDQYYAQVIRGVDKMCKGFSNLLFVKGRGAIGKTYQITKCLVQNKADFVSVCGQVTEAYLYRLIFENNGKIIYFKEVAKLLSSIGSINLLKNATETEEDRILTKSSYSKDQADLPDRFICKCKFIFDFNNLFGSQLKEDFEALATRGDYVELSFSDDDVENIMKHIAKGDSKKEEVLNIITNKYKENGMVKLNLRTLVKSMQTREYAEAVNKEWKSEVASELDIMSKNRALLYTLIGNKAVRTTELVKTLMKKEVLNCIRTCHRKINEWIFLEDLYKVSAEDRDFFICINPIRKI